MLSFVVVLELISILCIKISPIMAMAFNNTCIWEVDGFILNLTGLEPWGYGCNSKTDNTVNMLYTPCNNTLEVNGGHYMVFNEPKSGKYDAVAVWDPTIYPMYYYKYGSYLFKYHYHGPSYKSYFYLQYYCGGQKYHALSCNATTNGDKRYYALNIRSIYACNSNNTLSPLDDIFEKN